MIQIIDKKNIKSFKLGIMATDSIAAKEIQSIGKHPT
jgi:hypothetical protein